MALTGDPWIPTWGCTATAVSDSVYEILPYDGLGVRFCAVFAGLDISVDKGCIKRIRLDMERKTADIDAGASGASGRELILKIRKREDWQCRVNGVHAAGGEIWHGCV